MFLVIGLINNNGDEIWLTLVELIEEASETAKRLPFSWFSSFKNAQNNSFWKFPGERVLVSFYAYLKLYAVHKIIIMYYLLQLIATVVGQ